MHRCNRISSFLNHRLNSHFCDAHHFLQVALRLPLSALSETSKSYSVLATIERPRLTATKEPMDLGWT